MTEIIGEKIYIHLERDEVLDNKQKDHDGSKGSKGPTITRDRIPITFRIVTEDWLMPMPLIE